MNSAGQTPRGKGKGERANLGRRGAAIWRGFLRGAVFAGSASGFVACGSDETRIPVDPSEPAEDFRFQKVTLNGAPGEPIGLAVLPDGRVLHTTRGGRVFLHDPATGFNRVIANIPVYQHDEEGLQGIAIDAGFADNHWVYIYYSPPLGTPSDDPATPDFNE